MRFLKEDPWDRLAQLRERVPNVLLQMLLRAANAVGYTNYPDNVVRHFVRAGGRRRHRPLPRLRLAQLGREHARGDGRGARVRDAPARRPSATRATSLDPARPKYDLAYYVDWPGSSRRPARTSSASRTWPGSASPRPRGMLVRALREEIGMPVHFHTHDTSGIAGVSVLAAAEAGVDAVDAAMDPMSGLTSQPNLGLDRRGPARRAARDTGLDARAARRSGDLLGGRAAALRGASRATCARRRGRGLRARDARRPVHQPAPAGARARHRGAAGARSPGPTPRSTEMFGDIVKVTPTSKVVGDMAVFMVTNDLTPDDVLDPTAQIAFPESVVEYFHGRPGPAAGRLPGGAAAKVLKGEPPLTVRPGRGARRRPTSTRPARRSRSRLRRPVTDRELASYLHVPEGLRRLRRAPPHLRRRQRAAHARCSSTALPRDEELPSTSSGARR